MTTGIRATVEFPTTGVCPMVDRSMEEGVTIDTARSNVCGDNQSAKVTDFSLSGQISSDANQTPLFAGGGNHWYRLEHGEGINCPCECLGQLGIPVVRYFTNVRGLTIVFHAVGYDELKAAIAELRDRYPNVNVKRFVRTSSDDLSHEGAFIDQSRLTERQREVVGTALDMGYFARPRRANATEVAEELNITASTVSEHLAAAERKVFEDLLGQG